MRFREIHVDGFGVLHDLTLADLSPAINLVVGPNEAGKTTLRDFVRAVLFGFETGRNARKHEPLRGGTHGGHLVIDADGGPLVIRISAGARARGEQTVTGLDGAPRGEGALETLLGGVSRSYFANVHAFGLRELQDLGTLTGADMADYLFGASAGMDPRRLGETRRRLMERLQALLRPRGRSRIGELVDGLRLCRERIREHEEGLAVVPGLEEQRERMRASLADDEAALVTLQGARTEKSRTLALRSRWTELRRLEAHLAGTRHLETFPPDGEVRLERLALALRHARDTLRVARDAAERAREARRRAEPDRAVLERAERIIAVEGRRAHALALTVRIEELGREIEEQERGIEADLGLGPVAGDARAWRDRTEPAVRALEATASDRAPRRVGWTLLALAGISGIALPLSGLPAWSGAAAAIALGLIGLHRLHVARRRTGVRARLAAVRTRLGARDQRLGQLEDAGAAFARFRDEVRELARALNGDHDPGGEDPVSLAGRLLDRLHRARGAERDRAHWDDEVAARERAVLDAERASASAQRELDALQASVGAHDTTEFASLARAAAGRRRALEDADRLRRELTAEARRSPGSTAGAEGLLGDLDFDALGREVAELDARIADITADLNGRREAIGELNAKIRERRSSDQLARFRLEAERLRSSIASAAEEWSVIALAGHLVEAAARRFQEEHQPAVMRTAGDFFSRMTGGAFRHVYRPLDGSDAPLVCVRSNGTRMRPEELSRGTREELFLAIRFAVLRESAAARPSLPVVMDDVFVNFDPERASRAASVMVELSRTHQVLYFTCHPHIADMIQAAGPGTAAFRLGAESGSVAGR